MPTLDDLSDDLLAQPEPDEPSLAGGSCGLALAHAAVARARPGRGHEARVRPLLERAVAQLSEGDGVLAGLWGGLAGVGLVMELLRDASEPDPLGEVDLMLLEVAATWPEGSGLDWINGLSGLAAYAARRLPRPESVALLEAITSALAARAMRGPDGWAWNVEPDLTEAQGEGLHNLGVAHGHPGVMAALGVATAAQVPGASEALEAGLRWLLPRCGREMGGWDGSRAPTHPNAWCYGPYGAGAILAAVGERLRRPALVSQGRAIQRSALDRPPSPNYNAAICHGLAGALVLAPPEDAPAWRARLEAAPMPEVPGLLEGRAGLALAMAGGGDLLSGALGVG